MKKERKQRMNLKELEELAKEVECDTSKEALDKAFDKLDIKRVPDKKLDKKSNHSSGK